MCANLCSTVVLPQPASSMRVLLVQHLKVQVLSLTVHPSALPAVVCARLSFQLGVSLKRNPSEVTTWKKESERCAQLSCSEASLLSVALGLVSSLPLP